MKTKYLTDREFRRRKASLAGTLGESLAQRILKLEGFKLYLPWLLLEQLRFREPSSKRYYNLANEQAKAVYERYRDYDSLLKDDRVRGFLVAVGRRIERIESLPQDKTRLQLIWSPFLREHVLSRTSTESLPDFIGKKGKDLYAIEVKTGNAYLLASQVKGLQVADSYGLKPFVFHMKMDVEIREPCLFKMEDYPRKRKK